MITLHHLEKSRSQRIAWLLEEAGVDYAVEQYARHPKTQLAPKALEAIHPLGKSPVITDDGVAIAESGAIIEYVVDRHAPHLRPTDDAGRRAYAYWLHAAEGSLMPLLVTQLIFSRLSKRPIPLPVRPIGKMFAAGVRQQYVGPNLKKHLKLMEDTLAEAPYFAGAAFSAADIQMSFPVQAIRVTDGLKKTPRLADWLDRVEARPGWVAAEAKVGRLELTL